MFMPTILLLMATLNLSQPANSAGDVRMESMPVSSQRWIGRQWNANRFQDWQH